MQCPYCLAKFHKRPEKFKSQASSDGLYRIISYKCPECKEKVIEISGSNTGQGPNVRNAESVLSKDGQSCNQRSPVASEVPKEYAVDYEEACMIIAYSQKASAALSRRCVQRILRYTLGITRSDLFQEIQEVLESDLLPDDLSASVASIRQVADFAAHPQKSLSPGNIVSVEPQEAEWNLDVLEMLFEYLFVRPSFIRKKKEALNGKLRKADKALIR